WELRSAETAIAIGALAARVIAVVVSPRSACAWAVPVVGLVPIPAANTSVETATPVASPSPRVMFRIPPALSCVAAAMIAALLAGVNTPIPAAMSARAGIRAACRPPPSASPASPTATTTITITVGRRGPCVSIVRPPTHARAASAVSHSPADGRADVPQRQELRHREQDAEQELVGQQAADDA